MAKKKKKIEFTSELANVGIEPNEKPKTPEELEKERLLNMGKVNVKSPS